MKKTIAVIGAGYAGMSAAAILAKNGFDITVFESNEGPGGRASELKEEGFTFDKGPSFYWMPDVFENFFNLFGKSTADYYQLQRLDPSYKVVFKDRDPISLPADINEYKKIFESIETGAGAKLDQFLKEAKIKYEVGMGEFVFLPSLSFSEYLDPKLLSHALKLDLFTSMTRHISKYFSNPFLKQLLEFPVLFLGAKPSDTPALFSMMNYADIQLGTWYPEKGMYAVTKAFHKVCTEQGVQFRFSEKVNKIYKGNNGQLVLHTDKENLTYDIVISNADYHHTESRLLAPEYRNYNKTYWESKKLAPSALLYFLGFNKVLPHLEHHTLFFDASFDQHSKEIYDSHSWPLDPLFYTNNSSLTDPTCAPPDHHNMVVLIPVSTNLTDTDEIKEKYLDTVLDRLSKHCGIDCRKYLVYKKSYAHRDFIQEYNSYKGNAYGLANTLLQTGPLRPKIRNKKLPNLFYTGQLTVPGPGLPPAIISGQIVANFVIKEYRV